MDKKKLLTTNLFVYGLGGVISKIIPLLMVPIITRLLPNSFYFGLNDLSNTIISLFTSLAVMGMYDALFRIFFDKEDIEFKKDVCSTAFIFTIFTSLFVSLILVIFNKQISQLFYTDKEYGNLVILCALTVFIGSTNTIVSAPTRMQNKKWVFLIINTISPIIAYSISIPLIINGYYILAFPISSIISAAIFEFTFFILNKNWFSFKKFNKNYLKDMLKIAIPLIPNFIVYWIFNSCDRVMISNILGPSEDGIYSVAAKISQISNIIYVAFAGGWQYFTFSTMNDKESVKFISKIFELIIIISLSTTLIGTSICKIGTEILFPVEYHSCYVCIPYLYLSPLLLILFQIGSNQLLTKKITWPNLIFLSIGAVVNILLNIFLIPLIGIEGASIATFCGYVLSIILCCIYLLKHNLIIIKFKTICLILLFILLFIIMRSNVFTNYILNIVLAVSYVLIIIFVYRKDIKIKSKF